MPEAPIHMPPDAPPAATSPSPDSDSAGSADTSEGSSTEPGDKPGGPDFLSGRC